jgi:hypothetical protein
MGLISLRQLLARKKLFKGNDRRRRPMCTIELGRSDRIEIGEVEADGIITWQLARTDVPERLRHGTCMIRPRAIGMHAVSQQHACSLDRSFVRARTHACLQCSSLHGHVPRHHACMHLCTYKFSLVHVRGRVYT